MKIATFNINNVNKRLGNLVAARARADEFFTNDEKVVFGLGYQY
jgi:hypothetical protein